MLTTKTVNIYSKVNSVNEKETKQMNKNLTHEKSNFATPERLAAETRKKYEDLGKKQRIKTRNEPLFQLIKNYSQEKGSIQLISSTLDKQIAQGYRANREQMIELKTKLKSNKNICEWQALIMATMLLLPNLRTEAFQKLAESANKKHICIHCKMSQYEKIEEELANNQ